MLLGVIFAVVFVLVVMLASSYNRLVSMRNQALNGWRQIDVQLKRRHDLIPHPVNAVRGSTDLAPPPSHPQPRARRARLDGLRARHADRRDGSAIEGADRHRSG